VIAYDGARPAGRSRLGPDFSVRRLCGAADIERRAEPKVARGRRKIGSQPTIWRLRRRPAIVGQFGHGCISDGARLGCRSRARAAADEPEVCSAEGRCRHERCHVLCRTVEGSRRARDVQSIFSGLEVQAADARGVVCTARWWWGSRRGDRGQPPACGALSGL